MTTETPRPTLEAPPSLLWKCLSLFLGLSPDDPMPVLRKRSIYARCNCPRCLTPAQRRRRSQSAKALTAILASWDRPQSATPAKESEIDARIRSLETVLRLCELYEAAELPTMTNTKMRHHWFTQHIEQLLEDAKTEIKLARHD